MAPQRISFRDPVWLIPMVIVALGDISSMACGLARSSISRHCTNNPASNKAHRARMA